MKEALAISFFHLLPFAYAEWNVLLQVDAKKEEPQGYIFRSEDALQNENLMVLIHGSGAVRAGQWTRKLIINENIDTGSQFPYIRRAMADGFGVIVMNTNLNEAVINGKAREIRVGGQVGGTEKLVWCEGKAECVKKDTGSM